MSPNRSSGLFGRLRHPTAEDGSGVDTNLRCPDMLVGALSDDGPRGAAKGWSGKERNMKGDIRGALGGEQASEGEEE